MVAELLRFLCFQPRRPQVRAINPMALMTAEIIAVSCIPPDSQIEPPISAPTIRPMPAAARKVDIIVARNSGNSSVLIDKAETMVNSYVKKIKNRPTNDKERDCLIKGNAP